MLVSIESGYPPETPSRPIHLEVICILRYIVQTKIDNTKECRKRFFPVNK